MADMPATGNRTATHVNGNGRRLTDGSAVPINGVRFTTTKTLQDGSAHVNGNSHGLTDGSAVPINGVRFTTTKTLQDGSTRDYTGERGSIVHAVSGELETESIAMLLKKEEGLMKDLRLRIKELEKDGKFSEALDASSMLVKMPDSTKDDMIHDMELTGKVRFALEITVPTPPKRQKIWINGIEGTEMHEGFYYDRGPSHVEIAAEYIKNQIESLKDRERFVSRLLRLKQHHNEVSDQYIVSIISPQSGERTLIDQQNRRQLISALRGLGHAHPLLDSTHTPKKIHMRH